MLVGSDGIVWSAPDTAGILVAKQADQEKCAKHGSKLQGAHGAFQEDQSNQEVTIFDDVLDKVAENPDALTDHVLFKFPMKVVPCDIDETNCSDIKLNDFICCTIPKMVRQQDGSNLGMTGTVCVLTVHVGTKGTKKRFGNIDTKASIDEISEEVSGVTLSP